MNEKNNTKLEKSQANETLAGLPSESDNLKITIENNRKKAVEASRKKRKIYANGTTKQKRAIKLLSENRGLSVSRAMILAGYSEQTATTPSKLTTSDYFQQTLKQIDDSSIIRRWERWAIKDKDKRIALDAGKEIMKLKERYPKEDKNAINMPQFTIVFEGDRDTTSHKLYSATQKDSNVYELDEDIDGVGGAIDDEERD